MVEPNTKAELRDAFLDVLTPLQQGDPDVVNAVDEICERLWDLYSAQRLGRCTPPLNAVEYLFAQSMFTAVEDKIYREKVCQRLHGTTLPN